MKKIVFALLASCINLCAFAQQGLVTIVGELRMGNSFVDAQKVPFEQSLKVDLWYLPKNGDNRIKFETENLRPKEPYDKEPGTEISFSVPRDFLNKFSLKSSGFTLQGTFTFKSLNSYKTDSTSVFLDVALNNSQPFSKYSSDNVLKLNSPILLNAPERLTITLMLQNINNKLQFSSTTQQGYSNTVDKLERYMDDYYDNKKINYQTLIDFYSLLVFTNEYVNDNSFLNQEAKKLQERIKTLNFQLSDTLNKAQFIDRDSLLRELIVSSELYQNYQTTFSRLKDYNSRLQLILFLKAN